MLQHGHAEAFTSGNADLVIEEGVSVACHDFEGIMTVDPFKVSSYQDMDKPP